MARGLMLRQLPPSRAPMLLGIGWALVLCGLGFHALQPVVGNVFGWLGLLVLLASAGVLLSRIKPLGCVLVITPILLFALAKALAVAALAGASFAVALVAFAAQIVAIGLLVELRGMRSVGRLNPDYVRTHEVEGPGACTVEGDVLKIQGADRVEESIAFAELTRPKLVERGLSSELIVIDTAGDTRLHLRSLAPEDQEAMRRIAAAIAEGAS